MKPVWGKFLGLGLGLWAAALCAQPVITSQPTNQLTFLGSNVTFNVLVTGAGPLTYQWQFNGTNLSNNTITKVAGNGSSAFAGDGGPATNASIYNPTSVAADSRGNFLIADYNNMRIRRVNSNGIISTVAGSTVSPGFSGDGGIATLAKFYLPYGVTIDGWGNYFIADWGNNRIRKVDTNGIITTVAGNGASGYSGDGVAATNASIYAPHGVAVDNLGNLFVADTSNNRIRLIDTNGNITTFAGTNSSGFSGDGGLAKNARLDYPTGVAVDGSGNVFIADSNNNRIRRINAAGIITTFAGTNISGFSGDGGAATIARLSTPTEVAVDAYGYVFIADENNNRIRQVDLNGIITTVAGNVSTLNHPYGIAVEQAGSLLIADMSNSRIVRAPIGRIQTLSIGNITTNNAGNYQVIVNSLYGSVTSSMVSLTIVFAPSILMQPQSLGVLNGTAASFEVSARGTDPLNFQWYNNNNLIVDETNAVLNFPSATVAQAGSYYCVITNNYGSVTSSLASLTVLFPPNIVTQPTNQTVILGNVVTFNVAAAGTGPLNYQWQLNGTNLPDNTIITTVAGNGTNGYSGDGGPALNAKISNPQGVTVDTLGNLYIADYGNNRVRKVDTNGIITTFAGSGSYSSTGDGGPATNAGFAYIRALAIDVSSNLLIADMDGMKVRKVDVNGYISRVAGGGINSPGDGGPATNATMGFVTGVAEDTTGNMFIVDDTNDKIRKVNTNGIISTLASISGAEGVAVDANGNIYIASSGSIYKIDTQSNVTTVAGGFNSAYGVAVNWSNTLFIADYNNHNVKIMDTNGNITIVVGKVGSGGNLFYGDGGLATNAGIAPYGVATDVAGNLFIADSSNNRIRKVNFAGSPTLNLTSVTPTKATLAYSPPTNSAYVILNGAYPTNAGNFSVVITSPYGSVTSSIATLTVVLPPSITSQPANISVTNGASASFTASASSGTGSLNYQWFTSSGRTATAVPLMSGNRMAAVNISEGGSGYTSVPQVHAINNPSQSFTTLLSNGSIFRISPFGFQFFYIAPPTILIDNPTGTSNQALQGETNDTLNLTSVTSDDATNYFLVVTNNYGSVTSSIAGLWVYVPPQNFNASNIFGSNGNQLSLQLSGTPNYPYILQSATNLTPPISWNPIFTNVTDTNGNWSYTVTNLLTAPNLFYRAAVQ